MIHKITITLLALLVSVFATQAQMWQQVGADIMGTESGDGQSTIALNNDGSIVAVGAKMHNGGDGHVRVFQYSEAEQEWQQLGNDINGTSFEEFGDAISLNADGTTLAIGGIYYGTGDPGRAQIYNWTGSAWQLIGEIIGESYDYSGCSVSLNADGTKIAIGGTSAGGVFESGVARVFEYAGSGTTWNQIGADLQGVADERLGNQVALSAGGDTLAVGAYFNDDNGHNCGAVKVFENNTGNWEQIGSQINGNYANDWFGNFLAISDDGSRITAGGYLVNYIKVYECNAGNWQQLGTDISGTSGNTTISGNGQTVGVADFNYNSNIGRVLTYVFEANNWAPTANIINGNNSGDYFGAGIAINQNGSVLAGGATCTGSGNPTPEGYAKVFKKSFLPFIETQPFDQTNICPNANISFSITALLTDSYQWQVNEGAGFNDISDGGVYSNSTTTTLNITGVTINMDNYQYQCLLTNNEGNTISNIAIITIDDEIPTITCVDNQVRYLIEGETVYTASGIEFDPLTNDNCEVASVTNNINQLETLAGAEFPLGITEVIWTVTDIAGNENTCSFTVNVDGYVGIETVQQNNISIYPNPSNGSFTIVNDGLLITNIEIIDITGKVIQNQILTINNLQLTINKKGIYFIKVQSKNQIFTEKIIIQ